MSQINQRPKAEQRTETPVLPWFENCWLFMKILVPSIIPLTALRLAFLINSLYAGSAIGDTELAGYGLGYFFTQSLLVTIIWGMNGSFEILVAQAYGANQTKLCGTYLHLAYAINSIVFIVLAALIWFLIPLMG